MEGDKLSVVVSVDVECNTARIKVMGDVDTRNVRALYSVARRANALSPGLGIVLDLGRASATADALAELEHCAAFQVLPQDAGSADTACSLSLIPSARTAATAVSQVALAA
ncbi:hypothetical protein [Arthrobacter mangrovi]|uniref:STAS domain-containing protein n=1 Tax=Arthrobacter mangrovi TaxID=2966350 RepID=A0ABQ5MVN9_9MICC|nr:hypothetical protein [Arthrobacter mangrovi]GLB68009.1 hypothetical protein AHIS1636_24510 [Arthrobacter mangrovi]